MIGRREFLKQSIQILSAYFLKEELLYGFQDNKDKKINKIKKDLANHVHKIEITGKITIDGKPVQRTLQIGRGIILNQKLITVAHVFEIDENQSELYALFKVSEITPRLYGEKLEKKVLKFPEEIAIYEFPKSLHLEDFPCKPRRKMFLAEDTYLIGHPHERGLNIRKGKVSSLNGNPNMTKCLGFKNIKSYFKVTQKMESGDSGCPIISPDFKLLGLGSHSFHDKDHYAKKISYFLEELENLK